MNKLEKIYCETCGEYRTYEQINNKEICILCGRIINYKKGEEV